jgi:hypothetical protein
LYLASITFYLLIHPSFFQNHLLEIRVVRDLRMSSPHCILIIRLCTWPL